MATATVYRGNSALGRVAAGASWASSPWHAMVRRNHRLRVAAAIDRDYRIRDEALALAGRPRLHAGNCTPTPVARRDWH